MCVTHFRNTKEKGKGEEKAEIIRIPPTLVEQLYEVMKDGKYYPKIAATLMGYDGYSHFLTWAM